RPIGPSYPARRRRHSRRGTATADRTATSPRTSNLPARCSGVVGASALFLLWQPEGLRTPRTGCGPGGSGGTACSRSMARTIEGDEMTDLIQRIVNAIIRQEGMAADYTNPGNLRGAPWRTDPLIQKAFW